MHDVGVIMFTSFGSSVNQSIPHSKQTPPHRWWLKPHMYTYNVPSLWSQWLYQSTWRWYHSGIASWHPRSRLDLASGTGNQSWAGQWWRSIAVPRQTPSVLHWQPSVAHSTDCHHLHTCSSTVVGFSGYHTTGIVNVWFKICVVSQTQAQID